MTLLQNKKLLALFLISFLTVVLYGNTLDVPFYFDDETSIVESSVIHTGALSDIYQAYKLRFVGYWTFALNYQYGGGDVTSFHITNIVIHFINGLLVYWICALLFKFRPERGGVLDISEKWLPLLAALVFISHPLHTQAVTYIVQRSASLTALFYLVSVIAYVHCRIVKSKVRLVVWFCTLVISALLAIFTKQNAFTLPIVLFLTEVVLFRKLSNNQIVSILLAPFLILAGTCLLTPETLSVLDDLTTETKSYSRIEYFFAQANVLWIYIAKFFYPVPLRLEYLYDQHSFSNTQSYIALLAHLIVISSALLFSKRYSLICFGVLFYYSTMLVESSIIPIQDMAVEHRTYLPNVGLIIALMGLSSLLLEHCSSDKRKIYLFFVCSVFVVGAFSLLTYQRNEQWRDPITFYKHELKYGPDNPRVLNNLADAYFEIEEIDKALPLLKHSLSIDAENLTNTQAVNMLAMLIGYKKYEEAEELGESLINKIKRPFLKRGVLVNLGVMHLEQNQLEKSEVAFKRALNFKPITAKVMLGLAVSLAKQGKFDEAEFYTTQVIKVEPNNAGAKKLFNQIRQARQNE